MVRTVFSSLSLITSLLLITACADAMQGGAADQSSNQDAPAFESLFDGETLAGWRVNEGTGFIESSDRWTVEGGVIRGRFLNYFDAREKDENTDRPVNTWLVSDRTYSDFILRFNFRIDAGNSGFTYRSIIGAEALDSPEVDLDTGETTGQIYDTRTINGGYVNTDYLTTVDPDLLASAYIPDAFNQMELRVLGPNVKTILNGALLSDYDHDPDTPAGRPEGFIAMELHGSTIANFKDIEIHEYK
ncbi:MAG: hypothetical protein ACI80V_003792 [Rhodothermales bacterium]|jgi:hypothetical protein